MPSAIAAIGTAIAGAVGSVGDFLALDVGLPAGLSVNVLAPLIVYGGISAAGIGVLSLLDRPPKPIAQQTPIKQELPPRRSAYGRCRLAGAYMLFEAPSASALLVQAVHDGEADGLERFFYHDDEVDVDASAGGGAFGGYVNPGPTYPKGDKYYQRGHGPNGTWQYTLGATPSTGFPDLVDYCNLYGQGLWTSACRGDGIVAFYGRAAAVSIEHQQAVWPNGVPNLSASGRWQKVYDPRQNGVLTQGDPSTWLWSENPALCLLHFLVNHPAGPNLDFATRIQPNIADWSHAADVCDELVIRKYASAHIASQPWVEGSASGGSGDTLAALADGTAGIEAGFVGTLVAGDVIYFGSESNTVASLGAGVGSPPGVHGWVVNFANHFGFSHATNSPVTWTPTYGTLKEKRYRCGGAFDWDADPIQTIKQLLDCMDGWLATKGDGTLTLKAGEYTAPTIMITDPYVLDYEIQHFVADEEAVNEYKPTFTDPDRKFAETDAGAWQNVADIEARGVVRSQKLSLPWSPSGSQSRRVAKARMVRNVAELRGTIRTNLWGMNLLGERFVAMNVSDNAALNNIIVEITKVTIDLAHLSLAFDWVQVPSDGSLYDWVPDTDELPPFIPSGKGVLFSGLTAPTIASTTVLPVPATGNGVGSQLTVTVDNPPSDLAGAVNYIVRTAPTGTTNWTQQTLTDVVVGTATTTISTGFVPTADVDVEVAYQTANGISSWSSATTVEAAQPDLGAAQPITASGNLSGPALVNVWNNAGTPNVRYADNSLARQAHGFITTGNVSSGNLADVYFDGVMGNLSGLTAGDAWLGTGGAPTSSQPSASVTIQVVGTAISATELDFAPKAPTFP